MGAQENVLTSFGLHLVSKSDSILKFKVLKKSFCELSETIGVSLLLSQDERESNSLKGVAVKRGKLYARLVSLYTWLIVGSAQKECCNHVSHQVLRAQLNHVEVRVSKVDSIS